MSYKMSVSKVFETSHHFCIIVLRSEIIGEKKLDINQDVLISLLAGLVVEHV